MTTETENTPAKTCEIEKVLSEGVLKLVKAAPDNPVNRALVLKEIKKPLPEEATTFKQIKDWVEANIKSPEVVNPNDVAIVGSVTGWQDYTGNARFIDRRQWTANIQLTNEVLNQIVRDQINRGEADIESIWTDVYNELKESFWDSGFALDSTGDIQYSDREDDEDQEGEQDSSIGNWNAVRAAVKKWIVDHGLAGQVEGV